MECLACGGEMAADGSRCTVCDYVPIPKVISVHDLGVAGGYILAGEVAKRDATIAELREELRKSRSWQEPDGIQCTRCGELATCIGSYEEGEIEAACDECCGHGNEDGSCFPIAEWFGTVAARDATIAELRAEVNGHCTNDLAFARKEVERAWEQERVANGTADNMRAQRDDWKERYRLASDGRTAAEADLAEAVEILRDIDESDLRDGPELQAAMSAFLSRFPRNCRLP